MPFGVVSVVGRGMGVLDFGGDRRRGRSSLGENLGRPTVTNEDYAEQFCNSDVLFSNYFEDLFNFGVTNRCYVIAKVI